MLRTTKRIFHSSLLIRNGDELESEVFFCTISFRWPTDSVIFIQTLRMLNETCCSFLVALGTRRWTLISCLIGLLSSPRIQHCKQFQMRPIAMTGWSSLSVCWLHSWAMQKRLNWLRCHLEEGRLGLAKQLLMKGCQLFSADTQIYRASWYTFAVVTFKKTETKNICCFIVAVAASYQFCTKFVSNC